jgi:AcrR family transcriptional regulator
MPKIIATKETWVKLGYVIFAKQGISGIIIEKMARSLKVNKSSFYWHFKTKKDFIDEIVQYWIFTETEEIINKAEKSKNIINKWNSFLKIAFKNDPYLEFIFHLKRYAAKHSGIQTVIDNIDQHRLAFVSDLLQEFGYSKKEAVIKSSIFYKYLIGYHEMIRHKKQSKNYLEEVKNELNHFLNINYENH